MARWSAGAAPWTEGYRALRKEASSRGHVPGKGWRKVGEGVEWEKLPKRTATKRIRNPLTGRMVSVPTNDINDYWDSYVSYTQTGSPDLDVLRFTAEHGLGLEEGMAAYAEEAFDDKHKHYVVDGCGHIAKLEYNVRRQVMRVTFVNSGKDGNVVVYFRVPSTIFGELYTHATSQKTGVSAADGKERHLLGIRFWDLIRIRGSRHGSRYRFTYVQSAFEGGSESVAPTKVLTDSRGGRDDYELGEAWRNIFFSADTLERLFPENPVEDWASLPGGDKGGSAEERQQAAFREMYDLAGGKQRDAIRRASSLYVEGKNDAAMSLLIRAGVQPPAAIAEEAANQQA